jgi:hypothetical protein
LSSLLAVLASGFLFTESDSPDRAQLSKFFLLLFRIDLVAVETLTPFLLFILLDFEAYVVVTFTIVSAEIESFPELSLLRLLLGEALFLRLQNDILFIKVGRDGLVFRLLRRGIFHLLLLFFLFLDHVRHNDLSVILRADNDWPAG